MLLLRCATTAFVFAFVSAILCSTINAYDYGERECEFKCTSSSHCVYYYQLCDGTNDCLDGSDEGYCHVDCPEFACVDDPLRCLDKVDVCDNYEDCNDGSDELNCTQVKEIQTTTVTTTTTTFEGQLSKKFLRN
ncbi:unnamed protein product [Clavelina lepadiformis]|uniref:Uncharacterized protein n=1 Tax=Clavelina lepadiformis TaxID=159417 RepID=A0ABP0GIB2_CLALP